MKYLFLLVLLLSFTNCMAQDWIPVAQNGAGTITYIKKHVSNSGEKLFWEKHSVKSDDYKGKVYRNVQWVSLRKYNCRSFKQKLVKLTCYKSNGEFLYSYEYNDSESDWESPESDTNAGIAIREACRLF